MHSPYHAKASHALTRPCTGIPCIDQTMHGPHHTWATMRTRTEGMAQARTRM